MTLSSDFQTIHTAALRPGFVLVTKFKGGGAISVPILAWLTQRDLDNNYDNRVVPGVMSARGLIPANERLNRDTVRSEEVVFDYHWFNDDESRSNRTDGK